MPSCVTSHCGLFALRTISNLCMKVHSYNQEFFALSSLGMNMFLNSTGNRNNRRYVYDFATGAGHWCSTVGSFYSNTICLVKTITHLGHLLFQLRKVCNGRGQHGRSMARGTGYRNPQSLELKLLAVVSACFKIA